MQLNFRARSTRRFSPQKSSAFTHVNQTVVSCVSALTQKLGVNALFRHPGSANGLPFVVVEFHFDPLRLR